MVEILDQNQINALVNGSNSKEEKVKKYVPTLDEKLNYGRNARNVQEKIQEAMKEVQAKNMEDSEWIFGRGGGFFPDGDNLKYVTMDYKQAPDVFHGRLEKRGYKTIFDRLKDSWIDRKEEIQSEIKNSNSKEKPNAEEKIKEENRDNKLEQKEKELEERIAKRNFKIEELLKLIETLPDEFSTDFIKEKIENFLESTKKIKLEIKNLEVTGNNEEITLTTEVRAKKGIMFIKNINIKTVFENKESSVMVKNYKIVASSFQEKVEESLVPNLDKIPELLKSYIEKETGKMVEKIWIEDGELKVLYKKN